MTIEDQLLNDHILNFDQQLRPIRCEAINSEKLGNRAILLKSLLSEAECKQLISFVDLHDDSSLPLESQLKAASPSLEYRNDRTIFAQNTSLSSILTNRLQSCLIMCNQHELICDTSNQHLYLNEGLGFKGGIWKLDTVNPGLRFSKYNPHGHFSPHYDSDYVIDPLTCRSLKTMIIYLNDDYHGGETNFIQPYNIDVSYDQKKIPQHAPREYHIGSVKARAGDCVIFDHKIMHEGALVQDGCKYTVRSDIMYHKESYGDSMMLSAADKKEEDAIRIYYEGMKLEGEGRVDEAIAKYKVACKLCPALEFGV